LAKYKEYLNNNTELAWQHNGDSLYCS